MRYTASKKFDEIIQKKIEVIKKEILGELPETKSIILGGGFGRGEGSVEIRGGEAIPVNDFDMFLITDKEIEEKKINQVANKATRKLNLGRTGVPFYEFNRKHYANTFYVDLKAIPLKKLSSLPPMIRYYELKNASVVVHGENYLHLIPEYKLGDIPLAEGFRLLLNRMTMLSNYFSLDFAKNIGFDEMHGLRYLGSKAYLGSCAALLLLNKKFEPSYVKRSRNLKKSFKKDFPALSQKVPALPKKVEETTKFKLKPEFKEPFTPVKFWLDAREHIGEVTKYFVGKWLDLEINDYQELSKAIYSKAYEEYFGPYLEFFSGKKIGFKTKNQLLCRAVQRYLNIIYFYRMMRFRNIYYPRVLINTNSPDLTMFSALPLFLYSVNQELEVDNKMLIESGKMLKKTFPVKLNISSRKALWKEINTQYGNAYVLYFFQKII